MFGRAVGREIRRSHRDRRNQKFVEDGGGDAAVGVEGVLIPAEGGKMDLWRGSSLRMGGLRRSQVRSC